MDYTKITILGHEFHDDDWSMMLWHYYYMCCATITTFIMDTLRSIWSIEFSTIIRDTTNKLHDVDIDIFVASIDFFVGSMLIYGCISVFVRFIVGLLGSIATVNKDTTESKDTNKDPIENTEGDEPSLPSLPTGAVTTDTAPPLVSEAKGPRTAIKQLRDIRSFLEELESKVKELESSISEESSTFSANSTTDDSTTDDSTTDESASNEEQNQNYERIERDLSKAQRAQDKANARKWSDRQRRG